MASLRLYVTFTPYLVHYSESDEKGEKSPELHVFTSAGEGTVVRVAPDRLVEVVLPLRPGPIRTDDTVALQSYSYSKGDDAMCISQTGTAHVEIWALARARRMDDVELFKTQIQGLKKGRVRLVLRNADEIYLAHDRRFVPRPPKGWVHRNELRSREVLFPGGRFEDRPRIGEPGFYDTVRRAGTLVPAIPFAQEVQLPPYVTEAGSVPGVAYYLLAPARADPSLASEAYQKHVLRIVLRERGLAEDEFVRMASGAAGRPALREAASVLAEWATADVTALPYITDLVYASRRKPELIESFDEVRIRRCGDCEDFTSGILRNLEELVAAPRADPTLAALASVAKKFVAGACLSIVLYASVKGSASSKEIEDKLDEMQAHMMGLLIPRARMRLLLERAGEKADAPPELLASLDGDPADEDLPILVLEGTGRAAADVTSPASRAPRAAPDDPLASVRGLAPYVGSRTPEVRWKPWIPEAGEDGRKNWPAVASRLTAFYRMPVHLYVPEFYRFGRRGAYTFCYVSRPDGTGYLRRPVYGVQFEDLVYGALHVGLYATPKLTEEEERLSLDVLRRCEPIPLPRVPSDASAAPDGWDVLSAAARVATIGSRSHARARIRGPARGLRFLVPSGAMSAGIAREILTAAGGRPIEAFLQRFTDEVCAVAVRVLHV